MNFPTWDQISSGLQAVGTASQYISQAANAFKPAQTAPTVKTSATGNASPVGSGGDNTVMLAVLGLGALLLLKK